jgi:alpha-L-rhamnosidase
MASYNTTMWESFNADSRKISLNHWTHSAVSEWLWRNVAGLNPDEQHPGYQSFTIRPRPTKEVTWCKASYDSIRGKIVSDWKVDGNKFTLAIIVPANTTATVYVPAKNIESVTESGRILSKAAGVKFIKMEAGCAVLAVGSGNYQFVSDKS